MKFGEKIKTLRKEQKLSQADLAKAVGLSARAVQNYEIAGSYPKNREMYKKDRQLPEEQARAGKIRQTRCERCRAFSFTDNRVICRRRNYWGYKRWGYAGNSKRILGSKERKSKIHPQEVS